MAFTDFKNIGDVQERFSIKDAAADFVRVNDFDASEKLITHLEIVEKYVDARVSEFAIRENLIYPVLFEVYQRYAEKFSLWSHRFIKYDDVLIGTPDYFLARRSELGKRVLGKPIVLLTEAKKNDFDEGWAQCLAEMVAAQKINSSNLIIYGVVTDGELWQFGKLEQNLFTDNERSFTLDRLNELLGALDFIFAEMLRQIETDF